MKLANAFAPTPFDATVFLVQRLRLATFAYAASLMVLLVLGISPWIAAQPAPPCSDWGTMPVNSGFPSPGNRQGHAMATDWDRMTVVLFGGMSTSGFQSDTWGWDGGIGDETGTSIGWHLVPAAGPSARSEHGMAYDTQRRRIVLFGGIGSSGPLGETWELDVSIPSWVQVATTQSPSPRYGHALVYDISRQVLVLHGGRNNTTIFGDTWEYDGTNWVQANPSAAPSARWEHAMAYDADTQLTVLFGGRTGNLPTDVSNETWEYDGNWMQMAGAGTPSLDVPPNPNIPPLFANLGNDPPPFPLYESEDPVPSARSGHAMAYDGRCRGVVLYGGSPQANPTSTSPILTWRWTGTIWKPAAATAIPLPRVNHAMAYDPIHSQVMAYGGNGTDLPPQFYTDTIELCCPCVDEGTPPSALTPNGENVVYPSVLDPTEPTLPPVLVDDQSTQSVSSLYPDHDTYVDTWYEDASCPWSIDRGVIPSEVESIDTGSKVCEALGYPPGCNPATIEAEINAQLQIWEEAMANVTDPPLTFGSFPPEAPPLTPHCPDPNLQYVFGGRDIVFVHGFSPTALIHKLTGSNPDAAISWEQPTSWPSGVSQNQQYYRSGNGSSAVVGYHKQYAEDYWREHIDKFFRERNIRNRYLIVAWNSNDRLIEAVKAINNQIGDAMNFGKGVCDPMNGFESPLIDPPPNNFGNSSYVVISHSAGSLLTDVAMSLASCSVMGARYVALRCKAHVALNGAFRGSRYATAVVALAGVGGVVVAPFAWACPLGAGGLVGISPDNITLACLLSFPNLYNPLHWAGSDPGVYPLAPYVILVPPGLGGFEVDAVAIAFDANYGLLDAAPPRRFGI